jgi:hypothetical protein
MDPKITLSSVLPFYVLHLGSCFPVVVIILDTQLLSPTPKITNHYRKFLMEPVICVLCLEKNLFTGSDSFCNRWTPMILLLHALSCLVA